MGRRRGWKWATCVTLVTLASALVGALPASATIYERGTFHDEWSYSYDDCGFVINAEGSADGKYRIRTGKNRTQSAFFVRNNVSFQEIHTNAETGEWFLIRGHSLFNEVKAKRVEGTIFRFYAVEAGQPFILENSSGDVVLRDRGVIRWSILFDTLGDDVPGGEFLFEFEPIVRGPHPGFFADFCEVATELIG